MSGTNYPGNAVAVEPPDNEPQPGQPPIVYLPSDLTDGASWANIAQSQRRLADDLAYLKSGLWARYDEDFMLPTGAITGAPVANYGRLSTHLSASSTATLFNNASGTGLGGALASRIIQLNANPVANGFAYWSTSSGLVHFTGSLIFVLDINILLSGISANSFNHFVGLAPDGSVGWTTAIPPAGSLGIQLTGGTGQWTAYGAGAPVALNASYNPVGGNWQRFRLEYFGAATKQGVANSNTAFARYSLSLPQASALAVLGTINGAPAGGDCAVTGGTTSTGTTIGAGLSCSRWSAQWNPWGF